MMKYGLGKMAFVLAIAQSIFLLIYIWADGSAARPLMFNFLRFILSLLTGTILSLVTANLLDHNERK